MDFRDITDKKMRAIFGSAAFLFMAVIVVLILSPFVPAEKETIANVILGNALSWPAIVLAFYFGSSSGSKEKSQRANERPKGTAGDPVHVDDDERNLK